MYSLYQFVTGPLAWLAFGIFFIGVTARLVLYIKGLSWQGDRVTYTVNVSYGIKGAVRSIFFWLVPFGTRSWRDNPFFTILFFVFHFGLLFTPVFLQAHNILLQERWGFSLWTISDAAADFLTIAMMAAAVFLVIRRIGLPEVRIITNAYDYMVLLIAVAPFITGFLASQNVADYNFWLILHIISGEIMLAAIPFTKLSHFILFFCARAQIGMDFGIKRGGMKGRGLAW